MRAKTRHIHASTELVHACRHELDDRLMPYIRLRCVALLNEVGASSKRTNEEVARSQACGHFSYTAEVHVPFKRLNRIIDLCSRVNQVRFSVPSLCSLATSFGRRETNYRETREMSVRHIYVSSCCCSTAIFHCASDMLPSHSASPHKIGHSHQGKDLESKVVPVLPDSSDITVGKSYSTTLSRRTIPSRS